MIWATQKLEEWYGLLAEMQLALTRREVVQVKALGLVLYHELQWLTESSRVAHLVSVHNVLSGDFHRISDHLLDDWNDLMVTAKWMMEQTEQAKRRICLLYYHPQYVNELIARPDVDENFMLPKVDR